MFYSSPSSIQTLWDSYVSSQEDVVTVRQRRPRPVLPFRSRSICSTTVLSPQSCTIAVCEGGANLAPAPCVSGSHCPAMHIILVALVALGGFTRATLRIVALLKAGGRESEKCRRCWNRKNSGKDHVLERLGINAGLRLWQVVLYQAITC